ncbi:MAG: hypothetical protein IMX02_03240 [Limnochordaceae bacterium]|nr:hypothetical protein [Limnochordaceae bacterium]
MAEEAAEGRITGIASEPFRRALGETRWVLSPRDELFRRLTGEVATDPSCAGATGLFGMASRSWDERLCDLAGVDPSWLPPIRAATEVAGRLPARLHEATGLPSGLPVVLGAGDGVAQSLGTGFVQPGQLTVSLGTSGVVRTVTARPLLDLNSRARAPRLTVYPFLAGAGGELAWVANGATANAAGVLEWLRAAVLRRPLPMDEAASVVAGSDGLLFLPYLSGERTPLWEPSARGVWLGLTPAHTDAHLVRSAVEGVVMALRAVTGALAESGARVHLAALAGGGSIHPVTARILADGLGMPITRLPDPGLETVRGAAVLGLAARLREGSSLDEATLARHAARQLVPAPVEVVEPGPCAGAYAALFERFSELTQTLLPLFRRFYQERSATVA